MHLEDIPDKTWDRIENDYVRFFDELQAHIIIVGGRKIPSQELEEMPLRELMLIALNNGIEVKIKLK